MPVRLQLPETVDRIVLFRNRLFKQKQKKTFTNVRRPLLFTKSLIFTKRQGEKRPRGASSYFIPGTYISGAQRQGDTLILTLVPVFPLGCLVILGEIA
jgi:hypothetical protein